MAKNPTQVRTHRGNLHGMYWLGYRILTPVVHLLSRPRWDGLENLPSTGPFILAPNHMSNFDPVSMGYFLGDNGFEVRFLAKHSLFKVPVVGPFLRWWGMIPVLRGSDQAGDALKYAHEALVKGDVVGIYFEGTLTRDPGFWPMKGKTGLARLALDTRVPVVPVVQWGAQDIMDRYVGLSFNRRRPGLFVRVLPPIDYSDIEGDSSNHEGVRELTARLQRALGEGSEALRGEAGPREPWDQKLEGGPSKDELTSLSKWRRSLARASRRQDILAARPSFDRA